MSLKKIAEPIANEGLNENTLAQGHKAAIESTRKAFDNYWFTQGRKDGSSGIYQRPQPHQGARALSEYNIGHALGERESRT